MAHVDLHHRAIKKMMRMRTRSGSRTLQGPFTLDLLDIDNRNI